MVWFLTVQDQIENRSNMAAIFKMADGANISNLDNIDSISNSQGLSDSVTKILYSHINMTKQFYTIIIIMWYTVRHITLLVTAMMNCTNRCIQVQPQLRTRCMYKMCLTLPSLQSGYGRLHNLKSEESISEIYRQKS